MISKPSHPAARPGFTLVELLLVICIIGILIGILVPATASVFEFSKIVSCRNNMKQIATCVLNYAAQNQQQILPAAYMRDPSGTKYSNLYDAQHWCNILVDGGYIDAPNTSSLGNSKESTPKENVFRCPSSLDKRWTDSAKYPTAANHRDDAVMGFIRVGRPGRKIDCSYYWNGSSDTTLDTKGRMNALDFPSMVVPLGNTLTMDDVRADPGRHFHTLDSLNSLKTDVKDSGGLFVYTIGNLTTTIMLTDGSGIDAGTTPMAQNRARISAPHGGENGRRTYTNRAYWDGHVEEGAGANRGLTTDTDSYYTTPDLRGAGFRLSDH